MQDIKEIIAKNICDLRTANGLTQVKLAEALNYTDKAISKWERAESVPDIFVLKMLADYFGVTVDYIISENHTETHIKPTEQSFGKRNKILITLLAISLVWLIATLVFSFVLITAENPAVPAWMTYIYAIPVSSATLLVLNFVWGKQRFNFWIVSVLIWSAITSVYLSFLVTPISLNIWPVFIVGAPAEFIVLICSGLAFKRKK